VLDFRQLRAEAIEHAWNRGPLVWCREGEYRRVPDSSLATLVPLYRDWKWAEASGYSMNLPASAFTIQWDDLPPVQLRLDEAPGPGKSSRSARRIDAPAD
jgi:hypothetical protein